MFRILVTRGRLRKCSGLGNLLMRQAIVDLIGIAGDALFEFPIAQGSEAIARAVQALSGIEAHMRTVVLESWSRWHESNFAF